MHSLRDVGVAGRVIASFELNGLRVDRNITYRSALLPF